MFEFSLFILLAIVLVITSILVITRVNPISSALYLVFAFLALASLYGMLSASFVAAIQILVYSGGILVLIIFVIMIMNLTMEDLLPLRADYLLIVSLALIIIGGSLLPALFIISNYLNFDTIKIHGRVAQRKSASLTQKRSEVQVLSRPILELPRKELFTKRFRYRLNNPT